MGQVLNLCRLLMVGASAGPYLFDILSLIGKRETLSRISRGIEKIGVGS
jgi:glutamyl-tRNA synthetase